MQIKCIIQPFAPVITIKAMLLFAQDVSELFGIDIRLLLFLEKIRQIY